MKTRAIVIGIQDFLGNATDVEVTINGVPCCPLGNGLWEVRGIGPIRVSRGGESLLLSCGPQRQQEFLILEGKGTYFQVSVQPNRRFVVETREDLDLYLTRQ